MDAVETLLRGGAFVGFWCVRDEISRSTMIDLGDIREGEGL